MRDVLAQRAASRAASMLYRSMRPYETVEKTGFWRPITQNISQICARKERASLKLNFSISGWTRKLYTRTGSSPGGAEPRDDFLGEIFPSRRLLTGFGVDDRVVQPHIAEHRHKACPTQNVVRKETPRLGFELGSQ